MTDTDREGEDDRARETAEESSGGREAKADRGEKAENAGRPEPGGDPDEDPDSRLKDGGSSARDLGDLLDSLTQARSPLLRSGSVSMSGNFFFSETKIRDAVGGDKYTSAQATAFSGRIDSGRVPDRVLDEIRATFVPPDCHEPLVRLVETRHVVLLRAASGWGSTTNALRSLDRLCPGEVWKLNPEVRLGSLAVEHLQEDSGYLAESLEPEQVARLRPFHLEQLEDALAERRCKLLVTVDPDSPVPEDALGEWLFDATPGLDVQQLVLRHAARHLGVAPEAEETAFLQEEEVRELVEEAASDGLPVRRLADLAALLSLVGRGKAEVADVRSRFSAESDDLFRDWFGRQQATEQRALVIALAVLNEMPEHVIGRAAGLLADRIRAVESPGEPQPPDLFGESRRTRLQTAGACSYGSVEAGPYGPSRVQSLRFLDDRYPERTLRHVWHEYTGFRPLVVGWLKELADDPDRRVRLRAGTAIGLIALSAFEQIRREFLIVWAGDADIRRREVALGALQLPIRDPRLAPLISRMVADWSRPDHPWPIRWTATRALGASVGRAMPARALRLLRGLAADASGSGIIAVSDSVAELFVDPEKDLTGLVLDQLLGWTDPEAEDGSARLRKAGVQTFLWLCSGIRIEAPEGQGVWPGVLWLASQDDQHLERVSTLLRRALDAPHLFRRGYDLLLVWVRAARRDPLLRKPLGLLLSSLVAAGTDAGTLRRYLADWRAEDESLAETICVLLVFADGKADTT
ncbi:HEAT repeat domain-containing protein [Streptomyces sp. NBC_01262]|uniref:HEAT repeat domain-containing protein n=1 Tax=Streptomyces sp. NBC_01262 TaxID=2903803 RepID=UPI002E346876|nr:HEAT repeat domain-containing protein [Streptomyces sp. NBC_01262]